MGINDDNVAMFVAPFKSKNIMHETDILEPDLGIHPSMDYSCPRRDSCGFCPKEA